MVLYSCRLILDSCYIRVRFRNGCNRGPRAREWKRVECFGFGSWSSSSCSVTGLYIVFYMCFWKWPPNKLSCTLLFTCFLKMTPNETNFYIVFYMCFENDHKKHMFSFCFLHVFWKLPQTQHLFTLLFTCFLKMTPHKTHFYIFYMFVWTWPNKLFFYIIFYIFLHDFYTFLGNCPPNKTKTQEITQVGNETI